MGKKQNLTIAQRKFVQAVVTGMQKGEAYSLAYPRASRWRAESRMVAAAHLLQKPAVAKYYEEELARAEAEARARGDWTRQKSIIARLEWKQKVEEEVTQRKRAQSAEAQALLESPPVEMTPLDVVREICKILQRPVFSAGATAAYLQNLDGLDKAAGISHSFENESENEAVSFTLWDDMEGEPSDKESQEASKKEEGDGAC